MRDITFYLDFVSPYAWLAFEQLPQTLTGHSYRVQYRPVLLGALLQAHGNPGPAGIVPKRAWTYRHVTWLGAQMGLDLQMPARHPFPPLPLLRLALECSEDGSINRFVAGAIFRHVWQGGADALEPARLDALRAQLAQQLCADAQAPERAKQRGGSGRRRLWRAAVRGGWAPVLGAGRPADAARLSGRRCMVCTTLGRRCKRAARLERLNQRHAQCF